MPEQIEGGAGRHFQPPSPYVLLTDEVALGDQWGFSESRGSSTHFRDYLRVFIKYRWLILGICAAFVVSALVIVFTSDAQFTAATRIEIERREPNFAPVENASKSQDDLPYDQKYDYYQTRFKILQSRTTAARVIRALGLDTDPRFATDMEPGFVEALLSRAGEIVNTILGTQSTEENSVGELGVAPSYIDQYLDMLEIEPVEKSRLVDIRYTSEDRGLAADIANRHVTEFINASLESRLDLNLRAKEFLEEEIAKSRDRVLAAEAALNAYRKEHGVLSVEGEKSDIVSERLADLNARHTEAQADRIRLEGQYQLIKKRDYESLPEVLANSLIGDLKRQAATVEAETAELSKKFKPGYPKMREALARKTQTEQRIRAEIGKIVSGIESAYLAAQNREASLRKELDRQREVALDQKAVAADYGTLSRDVETARDLYKDLLRRVKDLDVAEEIKVSNVTVVDRATAPTDPSWPRKGLTLAVAGVGGLLFGLAVALFLEYMDNSLRTPSDVSQKLGLPTLGVVPAFDSPALAYGGYGYSNGNALVEVKASGSATNGGVPAPPLPDEAILSTHPRSIVAESYRAIRTKILLASADVPMKVVLFTSAIPGEGKTVTAVNQALALVQAGGKVLLIDADIRRPRLHRLFSAPTGHGLSTFLSGQSDLQKVVREVDLDGFPRAVPNGDGIAKGRLFVLPAGPLPPNPAELLGSRRMRDTLEALRSEFDYVVVDTPPVLPATDAVVLSPLCDGVVLVVRGQDTPIPLVRQARSDLEAAKAHIIGVVLNDVDLEGGDYYGDYRYRYAHDYADDAAA